MPIAAWDQPTAVPAVGASKAPATAASGIPDWSVAPTQTPVQKQAAANVAANPSQHVMNPLNPNNQIHAPLPKQGVLANFDIKQPFNMAGLNETNDQATKTLETIAKPFNFINDAIQGSTKALQVPAEVLSGPIENVLHIPGGDHGKTITDAYNNARNAGQMIRDAAQNRGITDKSSLDGIETIANATINSMFSASLGTGILGSTPEQSLTIDATKAQAALDNPDFSPTPQAKALFQNIIDNNSSLTLTQKSPGFFQNLIGKYILGGVGGPEGSATFTPGSDNPRLGAPEPFSNEATPQITSGAEPFSAEPGKVDQTLEPFSGKLIDQLPDRVVQVVSSKGGAPGSFFTIPIASAPSIIDSIDGSQNGIAGKDVNGNIYHVTAKSPSQMEALGFKNGGSFAESGMPNPEEGSINPGQAFKDIQDTIQKFKDNAQTNLEGQRLRTKFVGNKNARIAQTNQMLDSLKNIVKDPVEQEAISLARDFASKPAELQQFLNGTHPYYDELTTRFVKDNPTATPAEVAAFRQNALDNVQKFKAIIQKALNPSESMVAVNKSLDTYYEAKLTEGRKEGVLDSSIDPKEYISHLLTPKSKGFTSGGKFGKKFVHSIERNFPTQLHAAAANYMPKTMNAFTQTAIYEDRHASAVATSQFLQQLKAEGLLKFNSGTAPKDWRSVKVGNKLIYLPHNMADAVEPLLEQSTKPNSLLTGLTKYQATVKAAEVSLSVFHMKSLAIISINADGIPIALKAVMTNMQTPEFKAQELDFVKHGGTTSMLGKTIEAYRLANKSSIPTRGQLLKQLPGASAIVSLSDKLTRVTFDVLQREQKVTSYSTKVAAWLGKHPNATPEEIYNAKTDIAKVENAFYGGLNWESLGVSKMARTLAKGLFFAPDWLYSNILTAKYAFGSGPAGTAARRFWLSSIIYGLIATQMLSLAVSKKTSKHPFQVYFGNDKNGKEMYGNWFFVGAPGDLTKWLDNMNQYGATVGTAKTLGNKLSSIPRALVNLWQNKNYLGQQITIPGASPVVNTARGIIQFGSDTLPIPFSLTDLAQMLTNKKQDYKFWDYLSLVGGTPPSHQIPQGSHVPTTGKNKGNVVPNSAKSNARPQKSMLQQIETGGSIFKPKK